MTEPLRDQALRLAHQADCLDPQHYGSEWADKLIELVRLAKEGAYLERNKLVALIASLFPSGIKRTSIEGWSEDWHGCVYIDLPNGQASWHYHDSQAHLFAHLPPYAGDWDGHTTEEKYARIEALAAIDAWEGR